MKKTNPVVIANGRTSFQFAVEDAAAAWRCVLDFEALIGCIGGKGGNVTLTKGLNGQQGAVVLNEYSTVREIGDQIGHIKYHSNTYRFTQVNEPNKKIVIEYDYSGGEVHELVISIIPHPKSPHLSVVRFEYLYDFVAEEYEAAKCLLCMFCCCFSPLFLPCTRIVVNFRSKKRLKDVTKHIENHFSSYKPTQEASNIQYVQPVMQPVLAKAINASFPEATASGAKYNPYA